MILIPKNLKLIPVKKPEVRQKSVFSVQKCRAGLKSQIVYKIEYWSFQTEKMIPLGNQKYDFYRFFFGKKTEKSPKSPIMRPYTYLKHEIDIMQLRKHRKNNWRDYIRSNLKILSRIQIWYYLRSIQVIRVQT